ncbi:MAG TPA: ribosome-associated translation inhibitor RaiA [Candidatus Pelethosoma merdigallinarum]|nr:ribosome-associated translation inhibitor RaiA [Candidatus Pelethosoma merdigallinarum]
MVFNIRGSKLEVTEAIKAYIEKRIGRLDKYFENPGEMKANVLVHPSGVSQVVEVTIPAPKVILRAEDRDKDLYTAIDGVVEKLERQIRKNKTKMKHKIHNERFTFMNMDFDITEEEENKNTIIKRKQVDVKPMSEEEAVLQMDLLGHDFFVFKNAEDGHIAVVYKRKDNNYGIIETHE